MDAQKIIQTESNYVVQTYVRPEIVFTHGEGVTLYDTTGKQYLDCSIRANALAKILIL